MTGCSALGLLPVACASVGWQRARLVSSDRATKKSQCCRWSTPVASRSSSAGSRLYRTCATVHRLVSESLRPPTRKWGIHLERWVGAKVRDRRRGIAQRAPRHGARARQRLSESGSRGGSHRRALASGAETRWLEPATGRQLGQIQIEFVTVCWYNYTV